MSYIGLDIGGGSIKSALLINSAGGFKDSRTEYQTHHFGADNANDFLSELSTHIDSFLARSPKGERLQAIGLGSPGPLSPPRDKILSGIKLSLQILIGVNLAKELQARYKVPVFWENDANLFTLAESTLGAGWGYPSVFGVTIGSGLGGGLALRIKSHHHPGKDYKIFVGQFGSAAELGHTTIKSDGFDCYCGRKGCLEQYVSEQYLGNISPGLTINELHRRINLGFEWAEDILRQMAFFLAVGLANVSNILDPSVIVLGGGLMEQNADIFLKSVRENFQQQVFSQQTAQKTKILKGRLGYHAGAIGALVYAHQQLKHKPNQQSAIN